MTVEFNAEKKKGVYVLQLGSVSFGILLIAFGGILLLDQMGIISASHVFRFFWPAVLILVGVEATLAVNSINRFVGIFLILFGAVLLLGKLGYLHVTFAVILPLGLIYWGAFIALRAFRSKTVFGTPFVYAGASTADVPGAEANETTEPTADLQAVFAEVHRQVSAPNFKYGKVEAAFGEAHLDLSHAQIEGDQAVVKADAVFGACEIRVPETWKLSVRGSAVFGEYRDKTQQRDVPGSGAKTLIVKGSAVFGSVVVKN